MDIIEQIRQSFIEQLQDDDWHITDVRPSTEEVYRDYAHQVGAKRQDGWKYSHRGHQAEHSPFMAIRSRRAGNRGTK